MLRPIRSRRSSLGRGSAAALLIITMGCLPPGGSGGGEPDCRQANSACAEGFTCVPLGGGASYGCRANCAIDDDCVEDLVCRDGVCSNPPPRGIVDAAVDAAASEPAPDADPIDAARPVDMSIRIIDAEPRPVDEGLPPDEGPPSDACAGRADVSGVYLVLIPLTLALEFPLRYRAEVVVDPDAWQLSMSLQPLRREGRELVDRVPALATDPTPINADGSFVLGLNGLVSPSEGNVLGGDLVLDIVLRGSIRPVGALCGGITGELVEPQNLEVDGSVFAFGPWVAPIEDDPLSACAGCLPD